MRHVLSVLLGLFAMTQIAYSNNSARFESLVTEFNKEKTSVAANQFFAFLIEDGFMEETVVFSKNAPSDSLCALVWYWAAEYYYDMQQYHQAGEYGRQAMPYCQTLDQILEADCAALMAAAFCRLGNFQMAVSYAKQCNDIDRALGNPDNIASSYNTLAAIYMSMHRPDEAETYILEAIRYIQMANNPAREAVIYGMASEVYQVKNMPEKMLDYATRALTIEQSLGKTERVAVRQVQQAAALIAMEQYNEAEKSLGRAIPVLEQCNNLHSLGIAYNLMGDLLHFDEKNQQSAEYYYKALDIFVEQKDIYNESHSQEGLREALRTIDPQKALIHGDRYEQLRDSIYNREACDNLSYYATVMEKDKHLQEKADLQKEKVQYQQEKEKLLSEKKRQLKSFIICTGIIIIIFFILILIFIVMLHHMRRQQKESINTMMIKIEQLKQQNRLYNLINDVSKRALDEEATRDKIALQIAESSDDNLFLSRVVELVNQNLKEGNNSIEALAGELCMSVSTFRRKMINITGDSPKSFIMAIQLNKAKELLLSNPNMLVGDVANVCGFKEPNSFIRAFNRAVGMTPAQWREQQGKEGQIIEDN